MTKTYDAIVVGVGAMGSATCYHLSKQGVRVLGLEKHAVPHGLGSSHGYSRMIRMAYYEHPDYVPLLKRAYDLWRALESESGRTLMCLTGGLFLGEPTGEVISGILRSAQQHHLSYESLNRTELNERYPMFTVPDHFAGVYEPTAGLLLPELSISAHVEMALRTGAVVHGHEAVIGWNATANGVTVDTDLDRYHAGHLIFCGGPWSTDLIRGLGVPLTVTRQVMGWVWPQRPELFELGSFPVWGIAHSEGLHYGFPLLQDSPGLKIALHKPADVVSADTVDRSATAQDRKTIMPALSMFLPDGVGPLLSLRTCLYTNSPDGNFIIDSHPDHNNVTVACGFSGHGFKFAPVIGEGLAERVTVGKTNLATGFLGLSRFL